MAQAQKLAEDLKKAVAQAERARIERQSQFKLLEVEAAAEEAELQRDLDQAKTKLQKLARKRQDTVTAHERQQAQLNLMLEAREATTEKDEALRQCDALERRLHQAWAKGTLKEEPAGEASGKDLVACVDSVGADAVESMLRAESVAMRTAIRFYEKQQDDSDVALEAQREREALWKLEDQQAEEAAELDAAEERLVLGEACIADAFGMVETADDFHEELTELAQALSKQKTALEAAQERRDAWQDQASDLRHLLASAEARAAQLEKKLTSSSKSKASDALDALRQSGYQGAAALVVVLARLCGGPRLAFLAIDANNSGAVSTYEFDSALRMRLGLDYEAITGLKLRSLFKAFDTRHCGLVYGVDMVSAFADIWRTYGLPEEIARDPLLNPDLEGPAQDEVLKEQQRWLMEARARSPRRPRSSSPESRSPRTPRGGREMSPSRHAASPRELIRDEWQRGYHTVGIPLSPRSLKPQSVTLPGVSPRTHKKEKQRVEEEAQLSMASTLMSPKPNTLAALASTKHQTRESPKDGSGPALHVSKLRPLAPPTDTGLTQPLQSPLRSRSPSLLSPGVGRGREDDVEPSDSRRSAQSPNRAGSMADSKQVAAKHQQSLQSKAVGRGREDDVEPSDSRRSAQSPNRAGSMADSKQVAAKHQQSLQSKAVGRGREDDVEPSDSRRSAQSPNRSGAMADSKQVAAKHQQSLQSRAVESASEGHFVPFDSRQSPQLGHHVDDPDFFDALEHEDSRGDIARPEDDSHRPHPREKPANVETQRRRVSDADVDYATQRSPATSGHHSKARESQKLQSQKEASLTQAKSKEIATKPQSVMNASKKSSNIGRSEPGGAGPIPSPEVMSKAARARSLLYVPAQNDQKAKDGAAKTSGEMSGSMSSTLGMSKKPGRSELQRQNPQNQQKKTSPSSKQTASATLTEEELARRDSSPPSFMCGRSFGHSESILLPLRSTERHVLSLENSPSPTSERGLQDLTRGEQPQILWERSLSPDAKRAHRASEISFGKPEHFDTGDRSTASKSPGRPVTSSVSPRSHGTPSPSGRSTSPYSNRAIYVSDTPWSRPAPSPVRMKGWR